MSVLGRDATTHLSEYWGITRAQWIAEHGWQGKWYGDRCGCPDDRCAGFHHGEDDLCGCLDALASDMAHDLAARHIKVLYGVTG